MNVPNLLTLIRLMLVPVFVFVFFSQIPNSMLYSLLVFVFAGLTDVLDGYVARKYDLITKWGTVLDPLADKSMSLTVLICLVVKNILPFWILAVIGIKEILMVLGALILISRQIIVPAQYYGKATTFIFYISVIVLLFIDRFIGLLLIYTTVFLAIFSLAKYIENFSNLHRKA